jgi:hypothetical protein
MRIFIEVVGLSLASNSARLFSATGAVGAHGPGKKEKKGLDQYCSARELPVTMWVGRLVQ